MMNNWVVWSIDESPYFGDPDARLFHKQNSSQLTHFIIHNRCKFFTVRVLRLR
jgi:hypothetical protein